MKKCPFCSEEIQDDAIKCRYCNEWLDRRNTLGGLFSKAKGAINQQIEDYKSKTTGYLDLPTSDRPLKIDKIILYADKVEWDNLIFTFKDIQNIFFYSKTYNSKNSITKYLTFSLYIKTNNGLIKQTIFKEDEDNSILGKKISEKVREQINLMYKFISKATFYHRFSLYLQDLSTFGYFNYLNGVKIYKNGDIHLLNEFKANLIEAQNSGRLGLESYSNSNEICIYKDPGSMGVSYDRRLEFENLLVDFPLHLDSDIMKFFLVELLLNGGNINPDQMVKDYLKEQNI